MSKLIRSLLASGLVVAGVAACGDDVTIAPPPPPPTATVHSISVAPSGVNVPAGSTLQMSAAVNADAGVATTVTWSATGSGVSISNTGLVTTTAAALGGASVTACSTVVTSVCGNASLTITAPPAPVPTLITIQTITQGGIEFPVDLDNTSGQVDVVLNVDPGAGSIVKVQVLIDNVVAAEQCFSAGPCAVTAVRAEPPVANAVQPLVLSLNTRQVKKLANGLYIPVAFNGPRNFSAKLFTSAAPTVGQPSTNVIPVVLQNADAWVKGTTPVLTPSSLTPTFTNNVPVAGTVWYASNVNFVGGANYVSFFPVTPTITFSSICGASSNAVVGTYNTGISFSGSFPCGTSTTVEGAVSISNPVGSVTPGTAPAADVIYIAANTETTEQVGTVYTVNGDSRYNLLDGGTLAAGNSIRIDKKAPTVVLQNIAYNDGYDQDWINAAYDLGVNDITSTDAGTGVASERAVLDPVEAPVVACNGAAVPNPHGLAETLTSSGVDSYRICGGATDNIGNVSALTGPSNPFGVDNTAPLARLAGSTAATPSIAPSNTSAISSSANTTIYAIAAQINSQVFGLEGFDTRSGFNQTVVASFPDAATQTLARTLASGVTPCTVNDQLTNVLSDSWIRMPVLTLIECGSGLAGYYDYSGNVNDRAGNFSATIVRNFAYDLTAPTTSFVSPAQVTYTPGQSAAFNVIASDDLEVLKSYLSFSFNGMGPPAAGLVYPYGSVATLTIGSPWPSASPISALVPSAGTTGTISIPYLIGRVDESCVAAGIPYPSCGATVGSKTVAGDYNRDLNLNAPTASNAAQAPSGIVTNVQDIALRDGLTGAAFSFNPVTFVAPVAEQWSAATAIDTWIGKNGTGDCPASTICADQKTQTSNGLRFFTTVSLWRLNTATNQWTYCGDLVPQGPPAFVDNGVYRIWRSTLATPGASTTCGLLTGFYRVMGTMNGAGLFSPSF